MKPNQRRSGEDEGRSSCGGPTRVGMTIRYITVHADNTKHKSSKISKGVATCESSVYMKGGRMMNRLGYFSFPSLPLKMLLKRLCLATAQRIIW